MAQRSIRLRTSDVERIIENLENALRVHPEKGYEVGTLDEAEKFRKSREELLEKKIEMLGEPQKIKIGEKEFDQVGLLSANAIHTAPHQAAAKKRGATLPSSAPSHAEAPQ